MSTKVVALSALNKSSIQSTDTQADLTSLGNRVAKIEGYSLHVRLKQLEERLNYLENHTHNFQDANNTTKITQKAN